MAKKRRTVQSRNQKVKAGRKTLSEEKDDKVAASILGDLFKEDDDVLDTTNLEESMKYFALKKGFDPLTGIRNEKPTTKRKRRKRK